MFTFAVSLVLFCADGDGGRREDFSVSAWMTGAAREALRRRAGLAAVAQWEKQHGRFSVEEMNEARRAVRGQLGSHRAARRPA